MNFRITTALRLTVCAATLALAMPAAADQNAGAYLAARQAAISGDYDAAALYFRDALLADANNTALMEQTLAAYLGVGQVESAAGIARPFIDAGGESQIATKTLLYENRDIKVASDPGFTNENKTESVLCITCR